MTETETETETKMQAQAPAKALIPEYKDVQESKCEKRVNDDAKDSVKSGVCVGEKDKDKDKDKAKAKAQAKAQENILALIAAAQKGDQSAFVALAELYDPLIRATVAKFRIAEMTEADMEDLRQEALLAFYSALVSYDAGISEVAFGLYAKICLCNRLSSEMRGIRRRLRYGYLPLNQEEVLTRVSDEDPVAAIMARENERSLKIRIAAALSPYENRVFSMYVSGMRQSDMAKQLGMSEKSVANAVYRIRKKLKVLLQDET